MRSVAEGDVCGVAATAQRYRSATSEAELLSLLIDDLEITFDANRPIVEDGYLGCCHEVLQEIGKIFESPRTGYLHKILATAMENKKGGCRQTSSSVEQYYRLR